MSTKFEETFTRCPNRLVCKVATFSIQAHINPSKSRHSAFKKEYMNECIMFQNIFNPLFTCALVVLMECLNLDVQSIA